jgi:hypothetical protein
MASRIARKSTALPGSAAVVSYIRELPGAMFFGVPRRHFHVTGRTGATHEVDASITSIDRESLFYAARLQGIRRRDSPFPSSWGIVIAKKQASSDRKVRQASCKSPRLLRHGMEPHYFNLR